MSKSLKTVCLLIAAAGITVTAHNDVLSKSSAIRSENESTRVFETFIEKTSTGENSSISMQPYNSEVASQKSQNMTTRGENIETELEGAAPFSVIFDTRLLSQDVISYDWSFGDGQTANGARVSHTFQNQGTYLVTLKKMGRNGSMRLDEVMIKVSGAEPLQ